MSTPHWEEFIKVCALNKSFAALKLCANDAALLQAVNKLLLVATSRNLGFECLKELLPCLSQHILTENGLNWLNLALNQSQKIEGTNSNTNVIALIIKFSCKIQEFNKQLTSGALLKVIDVCVKSTKQEFAIRNNLECLEICLRTYPSSSGQVKNKIERFLLGFIDSESSSVISKLAGRCFHHLQQIGSAGTGNSKYVYNWSQSCKKLCKSLHETYDSFFEDIPQFEDYLVPAVDGLELPKLHGLNHDQNLILYARRLQNLTIYLQAMLETRYPAQKNIPVSAVLDVIKRGLSIHQCIFSANAKNNAQFAMLLMQQQNVTLKLLATFIAVLQLNLIPFSFNLTKLFVDLLKRTQSCKCFETNTEFLINFHKVFRYWVSTAKSNINRIFHEKLMTMLLKDVEPTNNDVLLNLNTSLTANKSTKAKKKAITEQITQSQVTQNGQNGNRSDFYAKQQTAEICSQSLQTLVAIFENVVVNVPNKTTMKLYKTVFETLEKIQLSTVTEPYDKKDCQKQLYTLLNAIIVQPTSEVAVPVKTCVNLFKNGLNSTENEIKLVCYKALDYLEAVCQPKCPSLYLESKMKNLDENGENFAEIDDKNSEKEEEELSSDELESEESSVLHEKIQSAIQLSKSDISLSKNDSFSKSDISLSKNDSLAKSNQSLSKNDSFSKSDISLSLSETVIVSNKSPDKSLNEPETDKSTPKNVVNILNITALDANSQVIDLVTPNQRKNPKIEAKEEETTPEVSKNSNGSSIIEISDNELETGSSPVKKMKFDLEDASSDEEMLDSFVDAIKEDL